MNKRSRRVFGIFCFLAFSCFSQSCNTNSESNLKGEKKESDHTQKIYGEAQGTTYSIIYLDSLGRSFKNDVDSILLNIDYSLSTYKDNSLISLVNNSKATQIELTDSFGYFKEVFDLSKEVHQLTNGAFDPTVMPLVKAWGFGRKKVSEMDTKLIDSLLPLVDFNKIALSTRNGKLIVVEKEDFRIQLDFNAIAQGYSVDVLGHYLEDKGIKNFLIELGGEIVAKGKNPKGFEWTVQLDKPVEGNYEREGFAKLSIIDEGLATSGNYRKFHLVNGKKVSHTINPKTGYPVNHNLLSATVLCKNSALADGYATAMMVMGEKEAKEFLEVNQKVGLEVFFISGKDIGFDTYSSPELENRVVKYKMEN